MSKQRGRVSAPFFMPDVSVKFVHFVSRKFVQSVHFVQTCQMPMNRLDKMNGLDKFTPIETSILSAEWRGLGVK